MRTFFRSAIVFSVFLFGLLGAQGAAVTAKDRQVYQQLIDSIHQNIKTTKLENGLTVISVPQTHTNQVVVSMTYDVGFVDEKPHEFGMAHIVEHMIFKGTTTLREGDLNKFAEHFGISLATGGMNAHTACNRTHYYFMTDAQNWRPFVDVTADCAQNMDWDSSALDSELGAIFQEIKLGGYDRLGTWIDLFASWLPHNHRYRHLGIGYKEDILRFSREDVLDFYKRYYTPDRGILMLVGNVNHDEVVSYAREKFASFVGERHEEEALPDGFFNNFANSHRVVYDTQNKYEYTYYWQGVARQTADEAALEYLLSALNKRLEQDWVDDKGWCLSVHAGQYNFRDQGAILVQVEPKADHKDIRFDELLNEYLSDIMQNGISEDEYAQIHRQEMRHLILLSEQPQLMSHQLVPQFFPHYSAQGWYERASYMNTVTHDAIRMAAQKYMRPFLMNSCKQVPLPDAEREEWVALQHKTDQHEKDLLAQRERLTTASDAAHEQDLVLPERHDLEALAAPTPDATFRLSNGLTVHYKHNAVTPTIHCSLLLQDSNAYDMAWGAEKKAFAANTWGSLLTHGTQKKSKKEFDDALDRMGATLIALKGLVMASGLKQDASGILSLLGEVMSEPLLPADILQRRKQEFEDALEIGKNDPRTQAARRLKETLFSVYPWNFTQEEEREHVRAITRDDICAYHQVMTDPSKVSCVIVGDISQEEAAQLLEDALGSLDGVGPNYLVPEVPALERYDAQHVELPVEQVQVRLYSPGVALGHADEPVYKILGEHLGRSLFDIREQTGLFYSSGAFYREHNKYLPGILLMATSTGPERVEALKVRMNQMLVDLQTNGLSREAFTQLKQQWLHNDAKYLRTSSDIAGSLGRSVTLAESWHITDEQRAAIAALSYEQANDVIKRITDPAAWMMLTAGRSTAAQA